MADTAALEVDSARVGYGELIAVWDVSLRVMPGRICGLVGRNGAGKSTLIAGIGGLLPLHSGTISLNGTDVTRVPAHKRIASGLGIVQEGKRIFRGMTVNDNLRLGCFGRRRDASFARGRALDEIYDRFPVLRERSDALAGQLSGGQQQMLAIAQALVPGPAVLCIDEPSAGLAPIIVEQVFEIIADLRGDGIAIVIVEQEAERILEIADDVVAIERGRTIMAGTADEVSAEAIAKLSIRGSV